MSQTALSHRTPPYRPFWVHRFFAFIDRLPIPSWLLCLLIIVIVALAAHLIAWQQAILPFGQINLYLSFVGVYLVFGPFFWVLFVGRANQTLREFFEGRGISAARIQALISDFNSLPEWEFVLLSIFGVVTGYFGYYSFTAPVIPISRLVLPSISLLSWSFNSCIIYLFFARSARQIALIRRFYKDIQVNIFNPQPIYLLSRYASLAGIVTLTAFYGLQLIVFPAFLWTNLGFYFQFLTVSISLSLFFIPLADIGTRMHRAKNRLLAELGTDLQKVQQKVHHSVEVKKLADISELRTAIGALKDEIEFVYKIRAWPWQSETLRNLLAPLLIPIVVYLVQRFLGGLIGF